MERNYGHTFYGFEPKHLNQFDFVLQEFGPLPGPCQYGPLPHPSQDDTLTGRSIVEFYFLVGSISLNWRIDVWINSN